MNAPTSSPARWLAPAAFALAVVGALVAASGGPGTRLGWWHFRTGFALMKYGAYVAIAALLLCIVASILAGRGGSRGAVALAVVGGIIALATWYVPFSWKRHAMSVPPIHDITTDFANPPQLTASRAMRDSVPGMNPWQYAGDSVAAQQKKAYPDVRAVMLAMTPDQAYGAAYQTARAMGWQIADANKDQRTIEAVDQTGWFGFKDDVSIRVTPASGIARVDVRSVSRVGRSDVGENAKRIKRYTDRLRADYKKDVAEEG